MPSTAGWTLTQWRAAWQDRDGGAGLVRQLLAHLRMAADPAWICLATEQQLDDQLAALRARWDAAGGELARLPLYGVPFAIKDNIDAAGWPTTAACPAFAHRAGESATVVRQLIDSGAVLIGKTNLDQFATGLVGTRSPYGAVPNSFDARYVSGGSSSGSASVVARGLVPFALGTDTAGSGRVPAGLNNLVGVKPTRGWFSTRGVLPACQTLDCVSLFTLTLDDAAALSAVIGRYDAADPWSRPAPPATSLQPGAIESAIAAAAAAPAGSAAAATPLAGVRIGIPDPLEFFGDRQAQAVFEANLAALRAAGAMVTPFDAQPLHQVAQLLYDGAWVAERHVVIAPLLATQPDAVHPVVRDIVMRATTQSADDAFAGIYKLAQLARQVEPLWQRFDLIVVPTAPAAYTIDQVMANPVELNSRLGLYTNFVNLLDWCALALPGGLRADGVPAGITALAPAWQDARLMGFARLWQRVSNWTLGATGLAQPAVAAAAVAGFASPLSDAAAAAGRVRLAVVGAHLRGMPLNHQLTSRHAGFVEATRTATAYRLYALPGTTPPKPGLARSADGAAIDVELWDLTPAAFGEFVAEIPSPLGIGTLELADGRLVKGFICEPYALGPALDITRFGGWRAYINSIKGDQA